MDNFFLIDGDEGGSIVNSTVFIYGLRIPLNLDYHFWRKFIVQNKKQIVLYLGMPAINKKVVNAWCMYDWANSVYSLVITSAIFPAYYNAVTSANGAETVDFFGFVVDNSVLLAYALAFSFFFVSAILPLLSGIADSNNGSPLGFR